MPLLVIAIIMMVVSFVITMAMMPKPENSQAGKLDVPTPDSSKPIGVVFGTVRIKSANVAWYGDTSTRAIRTKGGKK